MILANTLNGPEGGPAEKAGRLGDSSHHKTVQLFTIREWWRMLLHSAVYAVFGMLFSAMTALMMTTFPWDDSTVEQKRAVLFFLLPSFLVCHGPFAIIFLLWLSRLGRILIRSFLTVMEVLS